MILIWLVLVVLPYRAASGMASTTTLVERTVQLYYKVFQRRAIQFIDGLSELVTFVEVPGIGRFFALGMEGSPDLFESVKGHLEVRINH